MLESLTDRLIQEMDGQAHWPRAFQEECIAYIAGLHPSDVHLEEQMALTHLATTLAEYASHLASARAFEDRRRRTAAWASPPDLQPLSEPWLEAVAPMVPSTLPWPSGEDAPRCIICLCDTDHPARRLRCCGLELHVSCFGQAVTADPLRCPHCRSCFACLLQGSQCRACARTVAEDAARAAAIAAVAAREAQRAQHARETTEEAGIQAAAAGATPHPAPLPRPLPRPRMETAHQPGFGARAREALLTETASGTVRAAVPDVDPESAYPQPELPLASAGAPADPSLVAAQWTAIDRVDALQCAI
jgi:hypothetical protein